MDSAERSGGRLRSLPSPISKGFRHRGFMHHTHLEKDWSTGLSPNPYSCCHSVLIFHFLAPTHTTIVLTIAAILSQGLASGVCKWPDHNYFRLCRPCRRHYYHTTQLCHYSEKAAQTIHKGTIVTMIPLNFTYQTGISWINKMWYSYTMEHYSGITRNEIINTWMNFKCIMKVSHIPRLHWKKISVIGKSIKKESGLVVA